jgi:hypothetical protein
MSGLQLYFVISLVVFIIVTLYGIHTGKLNIF